MLLGVAAIHYRGVANLPTSSVLCLVRRDLRYLLNFSVTYQGVGRAGGSLCLCSAVLNVEETFIQLSALSRQDPLALTSYARPTTSFP